MECYLGPKVPSTHVYSTASWNQVAPSTLMSRGSEENKSGKEKTWRGEKRQDAVSLPAQYLQASHPISSPLKKLGKARVEAKIRLILKRRAETTKWKCHSMNAYQKRSKYNQNWFFEMINNTHIPLDSVERQKERERINYNEQNTDWNGANDEDLI